MIIRTEILIIGINDKIAIVYLEFAICQTVS